MEKRSINFELRAKKDSRTIFGTATVFNSPMTWDGMMKKCLRIR
jgi:trimethylamine:corrinoid methyltransferase-like protein